MQVRVHFYSYFKELCGCNQAEVEVPSGCTINELLQKCFARFPKLAPMHHSMLIAVGVEYQDRSYEVKPGDEVSLFPPVQGG